MDKYTTLRSSDFVNPISECFCHYVDSTVETKILHDHEYYELFVVIEGNIIHIINGSRQRLREGSLVFIRPHDKHTYECIHDEHAKIINISLSKKLVSLLFEYLSEEFPSKMLLKQEFPPMRQLSKSDKTWVKNRCERCYTFKWKKPQQLKIYVKTLLVEIFQKFFYEEVYDFCKIPQWLYELCEQMKKPDNFRLGVVRMVELSGKSREHLARSMKKFKNVSMTDYINELRINYAANMLVSSNYSILDICYNAGFQTVSWFYIQFEKKFGISPKQYKQKFCPFQFAKTDYSVLN